MRPPGQRRTVYLLPVSFYQAGPEQTIRALLPSGRFQQRRPVRPARANVFNLQRKAQRRKWTNGQLDGGAAGVLAEFTATP